MRMTMQAQDYVRVSEAVRTSLVTSLRDMSKDDSAVVAEAVTASYRRLAVVLARSFSSVNPRFRVPQFMADALGPVEGRAAMRLYEAAYSGRGQ